MNISLQNNLRINNYYGIYQQMPMFSNTLKTNNICFKSNSITDEQYKNAKEYADSCIRNYGRKFDFEIDELDLNKLNGIQKGIDVFDGMTMKEIVYTFRNLDGILIKRGCTNQCKHCFVSAMPPMAERYNQINSMPFEDFVNIMDGIKELENRIGLSIFTGDDSSEHMLGLYLDADCMEIALKDKEGKLHEMPEIIDKFYDSTDRQFIFDTGSWNPKNPIMQERAERYVKYFTDVENSRKISQVNLSISPFHSIYMKSLEFGFNPYDKSKNGDRAEEGKQLYDNYIERMANMLVTFAPVTKQRKCGIIARPISNDIPNMEEFNKEHYKVVTEDIFNKVSEKLNDDLQTNQKYISNEKELNYVLNIYRNNMRRFDHDIEILGKFKKLLKERNPNISENDLIDYFPDYPYTNPNGFFYKKKETNQYKRLIDINGKVYLTDDYETMIPTELQLNLSSKDKTTRRLGEKIADRIITKSEIEKYNFC